MEEIIKRILETNDGREFAQYLIAQMASLDSLEGITLNDPVELSIEVKARIRARDKVQEILRFFIEAKQDKPPSFDPTEYQV